MKPTGKIKADLDKKFQKVHETPAGFGFFVAIHDFIEHIEANPPLLQGLSGRIKANQELDITTKYEYLKKIYQGLEDINKETSADLGHARYAVIRELSQIQDKDTSESNSFWKKRESSRKLAGMIYERLGAYLS